MQASYLPASLVCLALTLLPGCMPRTFVQKNPDACDRGVRYYRPKPYLALRPHVDKNGVPVEGYVRIDLEYLPDFSEEYSLHIRSGWGINATSVTLDQGWNLTSLNVDLDSQTDENIKAVGALVGEVAGAASPRGPGSTNGFTVRASNVPLGYYEGVLGETCGEKRLYGFRYVGFVPFAACPLQPSGATQPYDCACQEQELYGLVFESGVMTFKSLAEIRAAVPEVRTGGTAPLGTLPTDHDPQEG